MRLSPHIFHLYPSEDLDYVLWYKGFDIVSTELSSAVPLSFETLNSLIKRFSKKKTLQPAKKARREGVKVIESNKWSLFWKILENNLKHHDAIPTHSLSEIKKLSSLFPDKVNQV